MQPFPRLIQLTRTFSPTSGRFGTRELFRQIKKEARLKPKDTTEGGCVMVTNASVAAPAALNHVLRPKFKADPKQALDKLLVRANKGLRAVDPDTQEFYYLAAGMDFLQELHFILFGKYRRMKSPHCNFRDSKKVAISSSNLLG